MAAWEGDGIEVFANRTARVGSLTIERALPARRRRMVGAWCFLDRFGPLRFADGNPIDVAPHPHMGLQTVTWLAQGEALHHDSLGNEALARPGFVNVMTSGHGISHAEATPARNTGALEGAQLWIALPDAVRDAPPSFEQVETPRVESRAATLEVFVGSFAGVRSAAPHHSELTGVALSRLGRETLTLELNAAFEYAVIPLDGACLLDGRRFEPGTLVSLAPGRRALEVAGDAASRALLLGGVPFGERILMWWNFVARSNDELAAARAAWEARERFGDMDASFGARVDAPPLVRLSER